MPVGKDNKLFSFEDFFFVYNFAKEYRFWNEKKIMVFRFSESKGQSFIC